MNVEIPIIAAIIYFLIGYLIRKYYDRKAFKQAYETVIRSSDTAGMHEDEIYRLTVREFDRIVWNYEMPPFFQFNLLWPVTLLVKGFLIVLDYFANSQKREFKGLLKSYIKEEKEKHPEKFI
jgi:hypothetical protein